MVEINFDKLDRTLVLAELSCNHLQSFDIAVRTIEAMKKAGADVHVIAALDDVCWITNLRGDDVDFFPLLLSYAVITMDEMKLYIDERKLNDDMKADLAKNNITIHPYNAIYEDIKNLDTASTVLVDPNV